MGHCGDLRKNIANIITAGRIVCSIALLFCPVFSPAFYTLYVTAGLTDIADGLAARKTNTVSNFGSGLDTVADFVFALVCFYKLIPIWSMPGWLSVWVGFIALIKLINLVSGLVLQGKLAAVHTVANKVSGGLLFLLPLSVTVIDFRYSAIAVCAVATFAAIQEGHKIRTADAP